jgi:hypothetical protein
MEKTLFTALVALTAVFAVCAAAGASDAGSGSALFPYATLEVNRDDKSGVVELVLTTQGKISGDKTIRNRVANGVELWEKFNKWYEDLFGLTYLDSDYKRLWSQLRKHCATQSKYFITDEMLDALHGCWLLVVVDKKYPFPADTFRIGDKWLFEIVPIVHSLSTGPKDLSDDTVYKSALVVDCQGPNDREGKEAPSVYENLGKIPGAKRKLILSLTRDETVKNLLSNPADVLHLATHAEPDEFFPGRQHPGIKATELAKMKLPFHMVLSTGCNTGNPVFAGGVLHGETKFMIASMYVTSGKDGVVFGGAFYPLLFSGKTPFDAFYAVKQNITGNKSDFPDILRFAFFVK